MKIVLVKNDENYVIGYNIIPETKDDKLTLGNVRNLHFYGFDDTHIVYDGMECDNNVEPREVTKLKFIQQKHVKQ